jgi:hypothetical protein
MLTRTRYLWLALTLIAATLALVACSPQQLYATGQAWRRSVCRDQLPADSRKCEAAVNGAQGGAASRP